MQFVVLAKGALGDQILDDWESVEESIQDAIEDGVSPADLKVMALSRVNTRLKVSITKARKSYKRRKQDEGPAVEETA
jgi:hypothetical protein